MPEGDTIFRTAQALHKHLAGRIVTRVTSRGKHILTFSGDLVLHTHMRMHGSWHGYAPGTPWRRPARDMRVLVATAEFVAVGFNVPVAELLTARDMSRHQALRELGPDLLDESFDASATVERARSRNGQAAAAVADVLLNQRVASGIGNVFKSEVLFVAGVHPLTPVSALSDAELGRIFGIGRDQLRANTAARARLAPSPGRRTRDSLDRGGALWVYGRGGKPCTGLDARLTYWCPRCQPPPSAA